MPGVSSSPITFAAQNGTGPKLRALLAPRHGVLAGLRWGRRAVEQAFTLGVEIAPMIRLQPIRQDAEQEEPRGKA
jgi:hypothetical protein